MNVDWRPTPKQFKAWELLNDKTHTDVLYGGGAGGGKSFFGCAWLIISCLQYPKTRWLMGRAELKALKQSTLLTFFELCSKWGFKRDEQYIYAEQSGVIKWANGSEIYLKDLKFNPSDPNFDSLGSTEYTGAFIDEASEVTLKAKNIVTSRLRYKLDEYNLVPKTLTCSNPAKNWMYADFYKPARAGALPAHRAFVPALVQDNPYISPHYISNLEKLDENSKQRLLHGNWEYDDDPSKLFEYRKLTDMYVNTFALRGRKYMSVDVARMGKDTTTVYVWDGLMVTKIYVFSKMRTDKLVERLKEIEHDEQISRSDIVVDEDGVGGGVVDHLSGCYGFVNNSTALVEKDVLLNYSNLKTQCYFKLSVFVAEGKIGVLPQQYRDVAIEELEQVKRKNADNDDQKVRVISKDDMKKNLGRSPDHADNFMMRMVFEIKKEVAWFFG